MDLDRLRVLSEAATPGHWQHGPLFWEVWNRTSDGSLDTRVVMVPRSGTDDRSGEVNAAFVAEAVNYVRQVLAEEAVGSKGQ